MPISQVTIADYSLINGYAAAARKTRAMFSGKPTTELQELQHFLHQYELEIPSKFGNSYLMQRAVTARPRLYKQLVKTNPSLSGNVKVVLHNNRFKVISADYVQSNGNGFLSHKTRCKINN